LLESNDVAKEEVQSVMNYPPSMPYTIDQMWLTVEPDFESKSIKGEEQLKLTARQTVDKVELDCATEMKIESVSFSFADRSRDPMKVGVRSS
jgi:hypothetical protein